MEKKRIKNNYKDSLAQGQPQPRHEGEREAYPWLTAPHHEEVSLRGAN